MYRFPATAFLCLFVLFASAEAFAQDCAVSAWSAWSACSEPCGGGIRTRTRTVTQQPGPGGAACPVLMQTEPCNTQLCIVDCEVSAWSAFGNCSVTCGGGTQTRTRMIITQPQNGGAACPVLSEDAACNTQPCVDCAVSAWSAWTPCTETCGGGTQTRTRTVTQQPDPDGLQCPVLMETQACNEMPCDCVLSDWSQFGECSAPCDGGTQTRTRTVVQQPDTGGAPCGALMEAMDCNTQDCVCGDGIVSDPETCDEDSADCVDCQLVPDMGMPDMGAGDMGAGDMGAGDMGSPDMGADMGSIDMPASDMSTAEPDLNETDDDEVAGGSVTGGTDSCSTVVRNTTVPPMGLLLLAVLVGLRRRTRRVRRTFPG